MLDITGPEFLALAVIALLVFGPDKLPKLAADVARFVRTVRRLASDARAEVRESLGPEFPDLSDIDVRGLDPRTFVTKHLFDGDDDLGDGNGVRDGNGDGVRDGNGDGVRDGNGGPRRNGSTALGAPRGTGAPRATGAALPPMAPGEMPPYDADAT